ncbi:KAP family P-loop NTPase fold protein, partial [Acinetobacter radioresistens]|uniref:KAP family P-loop NTPase fold protein n=1 Tax=Acinetobacter radioresistens TaxID=40216 RepID=UPI00209050B2
KKLIENYGGIMSNSYSSDSPVHVVEEDKFSRWQFSKRIADVIANRNDPSSIVIGLYGAWGNGKTSVLNFIENALSNNEDVITIKFNPWRFGTEEELLKSFFFDVANAIDTQLVTNGDKVKGAVKAIAPAITGLFGSSEVGQAISGFIPTVELEKLKERIESALETTKKRVLILIDDVDRLEKTEIHALFRLVKLTADFKYTAYILAFDKDIVASSLQERYSNSTNNAGEAFLEKIIQVPLYLPLIDYSILINYCFQGVDQALNMAGIDLSQDQASNFARLFTKYFGHSLSTPRKAKLYGNILLFSLPILKGEVNVIELMLIEAIRVFYPPIYELLRTNKDIFVGTFSESRYSSNNLEKEKLKTTLENAIDSCKGASKENIISLLKELFPKVTSSYQNMSYGSEWYSIWDKEQKVCAPNYYSRYFTYSINCTSSNLI